MASRLDGGWRYRLASIRLRRHLNNGFRALRCLAAGVAGTVPGAGVRTGANGIPAGRDQWSDTCSRGTSRPHRPVLASGPACGRRGVGDGTRRICSRGAFPGLGRPTCAAIMTMAPGTGPEGSSRRDWLTVLVRPSRRLLHVRDRFLHVRDDAVARCSRHRLPEVSVRHGGEQFGRSSAPGLTRGRARRPSRH